MGRIWYAQRRAEWDVFGMHKGDCLLDFKNTQRTQIGVWTILK